MFDNDRDNLLGKNDIWKVVDTITNFWEEVGQDKKDRLDNNSVMKNVLNKTDINRTGYIFFNEFKQIVTKSPEFADSFKVKL